MKCISPNIIVIYTLTCSVCTSSQCKLIYQPLIIKKYNFARSHPLIITTARACLEYGLSHANIYALHIYVDNFIEQKGEQPRRGQSNGAPASNELSLPLGDLAGSPRRQTPINQVPSVTCKNKTRSKFTTSYGRIWS